MVIPGLFRYSCCREIHIESFVNNIMNGNMIPVYAVCKLISLQSKTCLQSSSIYSKTLFWQKLYWIVINTIHICATKCLNHNLHTQYHFKCFIWQRAILFERCYSGPFVILKSLNIHPNKFEIFTIWLLQTAHEQITTYIILFVRACRWCSAALPWCKRIHVIHCPCSAIYIVAMCQYKV